MTNPRRVPTCATFSARWPAGIGGADLPFSRAAGGDECSDLVEHRDPCSNRNAKQAGHYSREVHDQKPFSDVRAGIRCDTPPPHQQRQDTDHRIEPEMLPGQEYQGQGRQERPACLACGVRQGVAITEACTSDERDRSDELDAENYRGDRFFSIPHARTPSAHPPTTASENRSCRETTPPTRS